MARDHRKLTAFTLADALALAVYRTTKTFPDDEKFGLTSQMRRAAVSVAANIVEGAARESEAEFLRFLTVAFASLRELGYFLDLSRRLGYFDAEAAQALLGDYEEAARVLRGLIRSIDHRGQR